MAKKTTKEEKKIKLRLLPDVPLGEGVSSDQDGLRFDQYANILARVALDTPEPFTIGVYGGWGSGKTSLMRMMADFVAKENNAVPVWFNAWRYEKEEHLIIPLLATIITEIDAETNKEKSTIIDPEIKKGAKSFRDALRGVLYGVSIKGKIGVPGITDAELSISPKDMVDRYEKLNEVATERLLDQSLYFRSFTKLDEITKGGKGPRLVVFIDDLDRCFPDKAVALLENIKLVLNQPNIAFVLGIAPKIIQAYLRAKYKKEYDIDNSLYDDYLDKLVQLPFQIPDVKQNIEDYVRGLLKRDEVFGEISDEDFEEEYEPLISICGPACKNNPRAIIRFLNRLLLLKQVHEARVGTTVSLVHFGITNALQMKWQTVWAACQRNWEIPDKSGNTQLFCEQIIEILTPKAKKKKADSTIVKELKEIISLDNIPEKQAFEILATDESLRELLKSRPGLEWLEDPDLREAITVTAEEVKPAEESEKTAPQYTPNWAEGYDKDGWPICRGYSIRPKADLMQADLGGANLMQANLGGANLIQAKLEGAYLREAKLEGANLREAKLIQANLREAKLIQANLREAKLEGANLEGTNLIQAKLTQAKLEGAYLREAKLEGANLGGAYLRGAYLRGAYLGGAYLIHANLIQANLIQANLEGAYLREAKLEGANLGGAYLRGAKLEGAKYDVNTVWPKGFSPENHGCVRVDE